SVRRVRAGVSGPDPRTGYQPFFSSFTTVPPLSVHSLSDFTFTQPLPLHSFLPAQAWLPSADAQAPLPLQALTPAHFTLPSSFLPASAENWYPVASMPTTAVATAKPIALRAFIAFPSSSVLFEWTDVPDTGDPLRVSPQASAGYYTSLTSLANMQRDA